MIPPNRGMCEHVCPIGKLPGLAEVLSLYLSNSEVLENLVGCLGAKCPGGEE